MWILICNYKTNDVMWGTVITQWYRAGRSYIRIQARAENFSHHCIQTGSGAHLASYPMRTRAFPSGWSDRIVKLTTHLHLVPKSRMRGATPPLLNTPSWRGAQLQHRDNFTFHLTMLYGSQSLRHGASSVCRWWWWPSVMAGGGGGGWNIKQLFGPK
jgi:hypothetical protein